MTGIKLARTRPQLSDCVTRPEHELRTLRANERLIAGFRQIVPVGDNSQCTLCGETEGKCIVHLRNKAFAYSRSLCGFQLAELPQKQSCNPLVYSTVHAALLTPLIHKHIEQEYG
ncbi:hypothetical protein IRJ41_011047 [Triplophysa rosa]|uniref:Uncharacterized protein n=1 Tax=Triplophysa rosa TaxID=992332 RepID=A0A9W7TSC3_TRIRA|nr:hypothetical protein IRJ41_011047 [Triplophysa rosa]